MRSDVAMRRGERKTLLVGGNDGFFFGGIARALALGVVAHCRRPGRAWDDVCGAADDGGTALTWAREPVCQPSASQQIHQHVNIDVLNEVFLLQIFKWLGVGIWVCDGSVCLSLHLSIYVSIYLSIYLSIYRSIYLSIYLSVYLSLSIYLSCKLHCIALNCIEWH